MATSEPKARESESMHIGAKLMGEVVKKEPRDSYQPNGLPPLDDSRHTPEVIESLQKRAMQVD